MQKKASAFTIRNGTLLVGIAKNKKLKICSKVKKLDEKVLSLAGIKDIWLDWIFHPVLRH